MFDKARLKFALENYKKDFPTWWQNEKYKWEAVKCFQDNWNIGATNFEEMIRRAFSKTYNLLSSANYLPQEMITEFAKNESATVREMFIALFDENQDIQERIKNFKSNADSVLKNYIANPKSKYKNVRSHYQHERAVTTYLWLRYPDKYYTYKFTEVKIVSDFLQSNYVFKKGAYYDNLKNFYNFYDEICKELKNHSEIIKLVKSQIDDLCYDDPKLKTLTIDICFYISNHLAESDVNKISVPANNSELQSNEFETYTKENFLSEVFISDEKYNSLVNLLERKKNIILQGAPGVGKTFAAKRLAYSIIGEKNDEQIEFVQFHQNYSYEDFIMGYKPTENNFKMQKGIFYNFCKKAESEPSKKFFFIIDEINRGNMSKIFGELLMLIESDKRKNEKIKLAYKPDEYFSVPENLYIIGMMNTADRSLAIIDYALRRRFSFFEMEPAFDSDGFKKYQDNFQNEIFNKLIEQIKILNQEISADKSLGKGFCIGHSYFCNLKNCTNEILRSIVEYEILPTLEEYYFDDENKLLDWKNNLHGVFQ